MYLVILKGVPYDLLNHVHNVGSKTTALEGPLADTPDLTPYEIKDAKSRSSGAILWSRFLE